MKDTICPLCGAALLEYPCPLCGYNGELDEPAVRPVEDEPRPSPVRQAPKTQKRPAPAGAKKKKRKKRKKRGNGLVTILVIVLLLMLVLLAGIGYLTVHFWQDATCTEPETCILCHTTQGSALGHSWAGGTCLTPGTCRVCGEIEPQPAGHRWQRPDCLTAGVCSVCGVPEPQAPGHDWADADCEHPVTCRSCGETQGKALGHQWDGQTQPAVCARCAAALNADQQAEVLVSSAGLSVFESMFLNPDWKALYQRAGIQDTAFEGGQQYAALMSGRTGAMSYREIDRTSAGEPRFEVLQGEERIAEYSLKRRSAEEAGWELGYLQLFITRPVTLTVRTGEGAVLYVNGVTVDNSYLTGTLRSPAAQYLPDDTPGLVTCAWQIPNLMAEPNVTVYNADGTPAFMTRDEATGVYVERASVSDELTDSERAMVFSALESYAGFMINAAGSRSGVTKYFENGTQTCQDILAMGSELWMNSDHGHSFKDETILSVRRWSDTIFAVRAHLIMDTTLRDGPHRDYVVEETLFFRYKNNRWACYAMTNRDVLSPEVSVDRTVHEWVDGICIEDYTGNTFNAHVMLVRDPTRVYLGLSSYTRFAESIPGKRLGDAIVDEGAVAVINAGAFNDDGTANLNVGAVPAGLTIYGGQKVSNTNKGMVPEKGFCGLTADGTLIVADTMSEAEAAELGIQYGCEFGPVLIRDGQINQTAYNKRGYNPRTVMGQLADGTLIFVCADGRQAGSLGATYGDMIELLLEYGAVNACNMDGGSSAAMLMRDSSGNVQFVNRYSPLQSYTRRMPTFWAVRPQ